MSDNEETSTTSLQVNDPDDQQPLCPCCFDLNPNLVEPSVPNDVRVDQREFVVSIRRDVAQLKAAAHSGCDSCSFILKALGFLGLLGELDTDGDFDLDRLYLRLPIAHGNPEISFDYSDIRQRVFVQLYTDASKGKSWNNIKPLPEICDSHLSSQSLEFVNACFRTCLEHHEHCRQENLSLPTRVVDIGVPGEDQVRLIETHDSKLQKYTALSYCWGNQASIKTTTGNLDDMKAGVALDILPPAYLDAIALTRELGVRYIWIDALCIIQDSQADWERECSSMADTYANAYLTIAAASSTSVTEHFLRPQLEPPPQYQQRVYSEPATTTTDTVLVKARLMWATGAHWKWQNIADHQPLVEPLTQRGWTLQEKVLSTRLLSISAMEMAWTCKERIFCECGSRLNYQREFGQTPLSQISKPSDAFNFWHKVIENYSKRNLTQPEDKLPAISAIASIIQQRIESDYVAGLWSDNIDLDLLWHRAGEVQTTSSSYIAPSFSWASITGEADYLCFINGKRPYHRASKVLEISSVTGPDAPLGRVSTSKLIIQGPISAGRIDYEKQGEYAVAYVGNTRFWFRPDTTLSTTVALGLDGVPETSVCRWAREHNKGDLAESSKKPDGQQDFKDAQEQNSSLIRCWVLRLGSFARRDKEKQNGHEILVLGKSPSQPDAFERIGLASSHYSDEEGELFVQETIATITIV